MSTSLDLYEFGQLRLDDQVSAVPNRHPIDREESTIETLPAASAPR